MKKLLLLCLPVLTVTGFQVWSHALAEPEPVQRPGIVVPGVSVASPTAHRQAPSGKLDSQRGSRAVTGPSYVRGHDGR